MLFKKNRRGNGAVEEPTVRATATDNGTQNRLFKSNHSASRSGAYDIPRKFLTEEEIASRTSQVRSQMPMAEQTVSKLGAYEVKRLEYEIYIDRFRFGADREAAMDRVRENQRLIFTTKLRTYAARICERLDNRRYLRALRMKCDGIGYRRIARPAIMNRKKAQLLELLRRKHNINLELQSLYDERYKDYVSAATDESLLGVRLRAAKSAYKRLYDVDLMLSRYNATPEEKSRLRELMNRFVDMSVEIATMRHRIKEHAVPAEQESLRSIVAERKRERDDLEDSIFRMIATIRRKTYLDSKRGAWRWVLGISLITLVLIALFVIFNEELTEFFMNWATKGR